MTLSARKELFELFFSLWLKLILGLALFLPLMSIFRITSWQTYGSHLPLNRELFQAFWMGVRFDSVVLFYIAAPPTLLLGIGLLLNQKLIYRIAEKMLPLYLTVMLSLVCFILAVDVKYYSFFQDHINILIFGFIEDDTWALVRTFWRNYPVVTYFLAALAIVFLIFKTSQKIFSLPPFRLRGLHSHWVQTLPVRFLIFLSMLLIVFLGGRGSFGLFPLGPADTVISQDPFVNYLTYNGAHALQRAIKLRSKQNNNWDNNLKAFGYSDPRLAFYDYFNIPVENLPEDLLGLLRKTSPANEWAVRTKPHVVVIVMESFGEYWLRYHGPQFNLLGRFEKHTEQDTFIRRFLPAAGSTTGSLSSLMISSPQRPIGNFLTESQYLQVPFRSSPARIFANQGYQTRFIYGGNPGWRDMNKFALHQGFSRVEGDVDIEAKLGPVKEKHDWGIYDEDLFRYIQAILEDATQPQMLLVMTTTNHPPYQIPTSYQPPPQIPPPDLAARFIGDPELIKNRFRTYLYSNEMLGQFMDQLKKSALAEKIILAVTGDHSFHLINFTDEETFGKWSVPLYLYFPKSSGLKVDSELFASHMDIFPTLISASLSSVEYDSLGQNLLAPAAASAAIHASGLIASRDGAVLSFSKDSAAHFRWDSTGQLMFKSEPTAQTNAMAKKYNSLMSLMDYYLMKEKSEQQ